MRFLFPVRSLFLVLSLFLSWGCSPPAASESAKEDSVTVDVEMLKQYSKQLQQYIDAMLLCGSTQPRDWDEAKHQFELLTPFFVFKEDPELVRKFRAGSEDARRELAKRGVILRSMLVFTGPYDRAKWDDARKILMDAGEPGQVLLASTLLQQLLNGRNQAVWVHLRYALAESGPVALETTAGLGRELADATPSDTAVFRMDDLVQVEMALISFGDAGRPHLDALAASPKPNVRRSVARAIGESKDGSAAPTLARLLTDPEWQVRAAAAESMGRMTSARATAGPALVARLTQERDPLVLRTALRAVGDLLYVDAIPDLVRVLEVPSRETAEAAMQALYILTGEKFLKREQWQDWYQKRYPAWKEKRGAKK